MASGSGRRCPAAPSACGSARRCSMIQRGGGAMADPRSDQGAGPERRAPLDGMLPWSLPGGAVRLSERRFAAQIGLRLKPPVPAYLEGVPLPLQPNRVASRGALRTLWLGPDEWLVTSPADPALDLAGRLRRAPSLRAGGARAPAGSPAKL